MVGRDPLKVYIVNQMVHWFFVGLTLPVLVLYMTDKGLDLFQAGMALSVYSGTVIALELPTGGLSDSIGRKKVYLLSLIFSLISGAVLLFAANLEWFILGFVIYGVARALSSGSMDAWFVDEFALRNPGGDLQKALAKANVFIPLGIGFGSLLGGIIPMLASDLPDAVEGMSIYSANIVLVMIVVLAQIVLTTVLVQERSFKGPMTGKTSFRALPTVLSDAISYGIKDRFTFVMMLSSVFLGFGLLSVELLWQPRAQMLMEDPSQTWVFGVLAAGYFAASSVGNLLASRGSELLGRKPLRSLTWIRILNGTVLLVLSWQTGLLEFAVLYLLLYVVFGLANSPHAAVFNAHIPKQRRSTLMSFESLMAQIGGLAGSLSIGWLAKSSGIGTAWAVAGIVFAASSTTYGYLWLRGRQALVAEPEQDDPTIAP
ncbi:MAG: MFS transporter [Methanomassiliicoccales archaeon]